MALTTTTLKLVCVDDSIFNILNFLYNMAKHEICLLDSEALKSLDLLNKNVNPLLDKAQSILSAVQSTLNDKA